MQKNDRNSTRNLEKEKKPKKEKRSEDTVDFKSEQSRSAQERPFLPDRKFKLSRRSRGCYSPQPETLTSSRDCQWIQIPLSPLYCCSYISIRQI